MTRIDKCYLSYAAVGANPLNRINCSFLASEFQTLKNLKKKKNSTDLQWFWLSTILNLCDIFERCWPEMLCRWTSPYFGKTAEQLATLHTVYISFIFCYYLRKHAFDNIVLWISLHNKVPYTHNTYFIQMCESWMFCFQFTYKIM